MTVQQEPVPAALNSYPLPTEYWTRPIEGQNTYWYTFHQTGLAHLTTLALTQATMVPADTKTMA